MAKTDATNRRKRQSKVVTNEVVEEEHTEGQTERTEMKPEEKDQDEQDSQMDTVIEVKANTPTVTVSWEKKNEEGEAEDLERTNSSDQMTAREMMRSGSQMDTATGESECTPTVTVTVAKKNEGGQSGRVKQETKGSEQMVVKELAVNGKRKTHSNVDISPSKKTKLINDGFCVFVGNLNTSKSFEEVRDSLANYFMTQSLLVQDIRLDRSKKHAHVDMASEMDVTKALTLNGEKILDKPLTIAKAKVKSEDKVKAPQVDKKVKDARCLFLKNIPYTATKKDILKVFHKAVAVRFPGGTKDPSKGIAFVEFKNKTIAKKVQQKKQGVKLQGRVLIVDCVGETAVPKVTNATDEDSNTKAAAPPNNILFVSNLLYRVKEKSLNKIFPKAVSIKMPQSKGKSKGYAFVEFATVADAEKALQESQNMKISKRQIRVQFFELREKPPKAKVISKTLIVRGLAEKTTAETLKGAFEEALSARVTVDKETGVSKSFGFVEFASEEKCKAVKEAMEDCEIDGSKVNVAYAKPKSEKSRQGARGGLAQRPGGQPAGRGAVRGGRGGRAGRGSRGGGGGRGAAVPQAAAKEVENKS
ncbi:nucleolin-like [Seriola lalandi dorsalis]|uniref:Nucleolin-like n=1 Tax=Seriola lalandi dorsalis TaxID=1841481 RepID=A0A3B4YAL7_SERLL|nr:nucleolin-like [Seriola lalandi dorsalis]